MSMHPCQHRSYGTLVLQEIEDEEDVILCTGDENLVNTVTLFQNEPAGASSFRFRPAGAGQCQITVTSLQFLKQVDK